MVKTSLKRKLLLLVALPLAFELFLISACFGLLSFAEREQGFESYASTTMKTLAFTLTNVTEQMFFLLRDYASRELTDIKEFEKMAKKTEETSNQLRVLAKQGELDDLDKVADKVEFVSDYTIKGYGRALNISDKEFEQTVFMFVPELKQLVSGSKDVFAEIKAKRYRIEKDSEALRSLLNSFLMISFALSVFIALAGTFAFYRIVSAPVKRLSDKTLLLATGKPIADDFESDDEIGSLHQSFVAMAKSLDAKRRFEKSVLDNSPDVVCTIDLGDSFTYINKACKSVLLYEPEELAGARLSNLLPDSHKEIVLENLDSIRAGGLGSFESPMKRKDGSTIHVLWSVRWSEEDGLLCCTIFDVEYEKQTAKISEDLREIATSTLKDRLKKTAENVDRLARAKKQGASRLLTKTSESLSRLSNMIEELDSVLLSGSTSLALNLSTVDVSKLIDTSRDSLSAMAEKKSITVNAQSSNLKVECDEKHIVRLLVNLLSNAIKFSPDGSRIDMNATRENGKVRFEICDQGPGISLKQQQALFERFSQTKVAEGNTLVEGSGLGLSIAKTIVDSHGGTIGVNSTPGKGTTFWFALQEPPNV